MKRRMGAYKRLIAPKDLMNTVTSRHPIGTNVFEKDWDLLVILDTCRVDALASVSDDYDFIGDVGRLLSVGSHSGEWMLKTFTDPYREEIADTVFVSGNVWDHRVINERQEFTRGWPNWAVVQPHAFLHLEHAWRLKRTLGEDHPDGYAAPDMITDRAIELGRSIDFDRMIVHYSPPHKPYVADAIEEGGRPLKPHEKSPFEALKNGTDRSIVWESYISNLHYVLRSVSTLLTNIDAETAVLTADHGEAFGEQWHYGHTRGSLHPSVKVVPWAETVAHDHGDYEPHYPEADALNVTSEETENLLREMGYID